ncbi:CocE/NonD family hydrolase [Nocardia sp. NBC_01499]|uniref:CocE/NonD family hydrolase n=1 Tax=Nocardia sp. NBC_01499 TaxID=2903597 RepID=UPI0038649EE6
MRGLPHMTLGVVVGIVVAAAAVLPGPTTASARAQPPVTVPPGVGVPADYRMPPTTFGVGYDLGKVIPLSNGTQITADVRYPTDPATGGPAVGPFPVVVNLTTYGALNGVITSAITSVFDELHIALPDELKDARRILNQATSQQDVLVRRGYIEVIADVAGTGSATGAWNPAAAEDGLDGTELVDWAARLPNSNGNVGMFGYSFPGVTAMRTAEQERPGSPLKAMVIHNTPNDIYKSLVTHDGMFSPILLTADIPLVQYLGVLGPLLNLPLTPQIVAQALIDHLRAAFASPDSPLLKLFDAYQDGSFAHKDQWWAERDFGPHLDRIAQNNIPTYFVDGIWDLYQDGAFQNYAQLQNIAAGRPQYGPMDPNQKGDPRFQLLQGPWYHVENGAGPYVRMDTDPITVAWFDHWLKGIDNGVAQDSQTLHVVDQSGHGANTTSYPFREAAPTTYRLTAGTLGTESSAAGTPPDQLTYSPVDNPCNRENFEQWTAGLLQFVLNLVDINDPCAANNVGPQYGPTYTGPPVDAPTIVAGPATLSTYISSTVDEAALQVYLDDVAPDGSSSNITGGAQLATARTLDPDKTWRTSTGAVLSAEHDLSSAGDTPLTPGQITQLDIRLRPTYFRLEPGHRLRVRISTGNFPSSFPAPTKIPGLLGSTVQIFHDADHPTTLVVPLAPADELHL